MPELDPQSGTITLLSLPKGKKHARAAGFGGGFAVGNIEGAQQPVRWVGGTAVPFGFEDTRRISANGGSDDQLAGCYRSAKDDERAVAWTLHGDALDGVELHPARWDRSNAVACGGGRQIGYGYQAFAKDPCVALLWSGTRDSMITLMPPAGMRESYGRATDGVRHAGYAGGNGTQHACLWLDDGASFVDLHPGQFRGSEAWATGHGQQTGCVWDDRYQQRAALWSGSASSFVDLSPTGHKRSCATACAHGFQAGWIAKKEMGMQMRAALWRGTAESRIDLHELVPAPFTASWASAMRVDGGTLHILGTAQQAVEQNGYEVNAGSLPVVWSFALRGNVEASKDRNADASKRRSADTAPFSKPAPEVASEERQIERLVSRFAQAIVDADFAAAHGMLAPWVAAERTPDALGAWLESHRYADAPRTGFVTESNDITLALLRELSEGGIPGEVSDDNFRQWLGISFTPDEDANAGVDYLHRLMVIVVMTEAGMKIGYLEQGE